MRHTYSQEQIYKIKSICDVIGDNAKLLILFELIKFGEKSFNELKRMTEINAVTLSKKLRELKDGKIVDSKKYGNENHYFATDDSKIYNPLIEEIDKIIKKGEKNIL